MLPIVLRLHGIRPRVGMPRAYAVYVTFIQAVSCLSHVGPVRVGTGLLHDTCSERWPSWRLGIRSPCNHQYISTTDNHLADDLSRDNAWLSMITHFRVPEADALPAHALPTLLVDLAPGPTRSGLCTSPR